jgi:Lrp/AsnC family leucine-responsive transcriptional regulator
MPSIKLEARDIRILSALQADGRPTKQDVAERVDLALLAAGEAGVIRGYQAVLERRALDLGVLAFARVTIDSHAATRRSASRRRCRRSTRSSPAGRSPARPTFC